MTAHDLPIVIPAVESALYLLLVAVALASSDFQKRARRALILYVSLSFLWMSIQAAWRLGWLDFPGADAHLLARAPAYGLFLRALLFLHLSRSFLRLEGTRRGWWGLGLAWLALLVVLDGNLLSLPDVWWESRAGTVQRTGFAFALLIVGWAVFALATTLLTLSAHRRSQQPLHRNRIKYWVPALAFTVAGDAVFLAEREALGAALGLLGALIATYAVATHRLPDVRHAMRRASSYLPITLISVAIYTASFATTQHLFQNLPGYHPLLTGAIMALVLAILFQPLLNLLQRLVNRLIFGAGYDPGHTLRQYSISISNILDLGLLANTMVKLISEALGVQHGRLFLVDRKQKPDRAIYFRLRDAGGVGDKGTNPGLLSDDSPVSEHLHGQRRPLTQYDIDLLPRFQAIAAAERAWLSSLDTDVYVPIHAQGEWMGLLALGPKLSRDRYFDEDLALLGTLADQTAVALENARLVEDLVQSNQEIGQAYAALHEANRQLQELDRLKSSFIGVITHELRTPFANIGFCLELLERHGRAHLPPELHEQLDQLNAGIHAAKTMIDNLVTFSTFLSKRGQLHLTQLDFGQVIQDSLPPLRTLAEAQQVTLHAELPARLPPLRGDCERLADAIYHLVHNAIKFTAAGGEVWVRCQATADALRFEVQDTGVGIPADKLPALWEDFMQMADPLRRGVEGLGLGLALVKYVANAHGGDVRAASEPGVGSTFGFDLPLTR